MIISGTDITTFEAEVLPDFMPDTRLALIWKQAENGNFIPVDRGAAEDVYESSIRLYGRESVISNFVDEIEGNRIASSGTPNIVTLSSFSSTEKIFGANVDYSVNISATLFVDKIMQGTWKGFGIPLKVRALSPSFDGLTSLPSLRNLLVGFEADNELTIKKFDSYTGTFSYQDRRSDAGLFSGTFIFTTNDMILLRNYIRTQRGGLFTISEIKGVTNMFGPRRSSSSYPCLCRLISWADMGMLDVKFWQMKLTFAEEVA